MRDEGKGFVAAHNALTALESWPEFGELLGGRYDGHPWNVAPGTVINEGSDFPATKHFPASFAMTEEFYQPKDFSRDKARVLLRLDLSKMAPQPDVHVQNGDMPLVVGEELRQGPRVLFGARPRRRARGTTATSRRCTSRPSSGRWASPTATLRRARSPQASQGFCLDRSRQNPWPAGSISCGALRAPGTAMRMAVTSESRSGQHSGPMTRLAGALTAVLAIGASAVMLSAQDWPYRGGDAGEQRFSSLKQITPANVANLRQAWAFDVGTSNLQVTPLVVNGVMYLSGGSNVFALEPESGKVLWKFETPAPVGRRGLAYWPGDGSAPPRILQGAGDRLLALDAKTGKLASEFGGFGWVDLNLGIKGDADGRITMQSPPAIYKNVIITGGNNGENSPSLGLYGDIRGWDARSGKLLWTFHTVPRPGEPGSDTWEGDELEGSLGHEYLVVLHC